MYKYTYLYIYTFIYIAYLRKHIHYMPNLIKKRIIYYSILYICVYLYHILIIVTRLDSHTRCRFVKNIIQVQFNALFNYIRLFESEIR